MEDQRDLFEEENNEPQEHSKRPNLLNVVCILSFINIGFGLMGSLTGFLGGKASPEELENSMLFFTELKNKFDDGASEQMSLVIEQLKDIIMYTNDNYYLALFITFIGLLTGLIGVLLMYKGKKNGFHLYIIYNLIAVYGLYLYVPTTSVPMVSIITNSILSLIFILMYAKNLSWMK